MKDRPQPRRVSNFGRYPRVSETHLSLFIPSPNVIPSPYTRMMMKMKMKIQSPYLISPSPRHPGETALAGEPPATPAAMSASRKAAEQTKLNDWLEGSCTPALADGDQPIYGKPRNSRGRILSMAERDYASCVARGLLCCSYVGVQIGGGQGKLENLTSILLCNVTNPGHRQRDGGDRVGDSLTGPGLSGEQLQRFPYVLANSDRCDILNNLDKPGVSCSHHQCQRLYEYPSSQASRVHVLDKGLVNASRSRRGVVQDTPPASTPS